MNLTHQTTVHLFMLVIYIIILYIYDRARVKSKLFLLEGTPRSGAKTLLTFLAWKLI